MVEKLIEIQRLGLCMNKIAQAELAEYNHLRVQRTIIPADCHGRLNQVLQNMEFAESASPEVNIQMTKYQLPVTR